MGLRGHHVKGGRGGGRLVGSGSILIGPKSSTSDRCIGLYWK